MGTNNFFPGIGFRTVGRDWNYYNKINVTWNTFGGGSVDGYQPDAIITFPTQSVILLNEDTTNIIQVSFNGNTLHDELNPTTSTKGLAYDNRVVSTIWFRVVGAGSAVVSIRAWSTR